MDRLTATSPNWVVDSDPESPNSAKAQVIEKPNSEWQIEDQPRPEQKILFDSLAVSGTHEDCPIETVFSIEEDKEDCSKENLFFKIEGDAVDGQRELRLGHEEITKQDTPMIEHQLSIDEQLSNKKAELIVEEDLLPIEDAPDGKKSSRSRKGHMVEQEPSQKTFLVENPQKINEQLIIQDAEQSIDQKLLELSLQEIDHRTDHTFHAKTDVQKDNDVIEQETKHEKDISFQEIGCDGEIQTANLEKDDHENDVIMEEERIPITAEESIPMVVEDENVPASVEEGINPPVLVEAKTLPILIDVRTLPVSFEVETVPVVVEEKTAQSPVEEGIPPIVIEDNTVQAPIEVKDEYIPTSAVDASVPTSVGENVAMVDEAENFPVTAEGSIAMVVEGKNVPASVEKGINPPVLVEARTLPILIDVRTLPVSFETENVLVSVEEGIPPVVVDVNVQAPIEEETVQAPVEEGISQVLVEDVNAQTPIEEETVQAPVEEKTVQASVEEGIPQVLVEDVNVQTPIEEETVQAPVEEKTVQASVEEGIPQVLVEDVNVQTPIEEETVQPSVEDKTVQSPVEEGIPPVVTEDVNVPTPFEEEKVTASADEGKVHVLAVDENVPVSGEEETVQASVEEFNLPAVDLDRNVSVSVEEEKVTVSETVASSVETENLSVAKENTPTEIIDMEPKDVIPQPAAIASKGEHSESCQSLKTTELSETRGEEVQNEKTIVAPACDPVEEEVSAAAFNESSSPVVNSASTVGGVTSMSISSSSPSTKVENTPPGDMLHHIKNIQFKDKNAGIVTQNENGPCPLVAIINVLLLRRQITLPAHLEIVSAAKLMEYIGDAMLESVPKNLSGEVRLNYEQNMHDAMAVLPKLQTGLDVNVKFTGVRDFEYTPECIIFDLLRIPLFHGWLVDPQTPEVVAAVGQAGYNQLVEKVISQKFSNDENAAHEALVIENFLERSASQLTYHGLGELTTSMEDDEIGVLFRNNHFSTIYKRQKELLQLVTDQGFLGESSVVWETLGSIDGDGQFVDSQFRTVPPKPELTPSGDSASPNTSAQLTAEQQIDHDFLVALSLQEEQPAAVQQEEVAREVGEDVARSLAEDEKTTTQLQEFMDLELARQLQQEEERQAAEAETVETAASSHPPPATGQRSPSTGSRQQHSKKKSCTFL